MAQTQEISRSQDVTPNGGGAELTCEAYEVVEQADATRRVGLILGGLVLAIGVVFGAYYKSLNVGFLLDDYQHLSYIFSAFHGDFSGLLKTFCGNWTGQTDGLTSFRPGISLLFCLDYLVSGLDPRGYHAFNLLFFSGCTYLVGVISYQLVDDDSYLRRCVCASAAMVLFALYPIHTESVAWIIGRVDVYCTFFYLLSLSLFFHFRENGRKGWLAASLVAFFLSLTCKEMAVTLPVVLAFAEILLARPLKWQVKGLQGRAAPVASFFAVLAGFAVLRTVLLGTLVGGYGSTSFRSFWKGLKNFLDVATFDKILFGVNEEQPFSSQIAGWAKVAWSVVGFGLLLRLLQTIDRTRVLLFVALWLAVSEIPTFQIWHIFPNLVGSRLFFLGSAAMCVLLAVALIPSIRLTRPLISSPLFRFGARLLSVFPVVALVALMVCWANGLKHNLFPFEEAGRQVREAKRNLIESIETLPDGKHLLVLDLPQDFSGAGMIGRPEYLEQMLDPPVEQRRLGDRVVTMERPMPGSHEYTYPRLLMSVYSHPDRAKCYSWRTEQNSYEDWEKPTGAAALALSGSDLKEREVSKLVAPHIVWLPTTELDPFALSLIEIDVKTTLPIEQLTPNARLVWRSEHQPKSWIDYSEGPFAEVKNEKLVFVPERLRSWVLNGSIKEIGVLFYPGEYKASIESVTGISSASVVPSLDLIPSRTSSHDSMLKRLVVPTVSRDSFVDVSYNAENVAEAHSVEVVVTNNNYAFPDFNSIVIPEDKHILFRTRVKNLSGVYRLPQPAIVFGKHQVAVRALNDKGDPVGYLSEPRTYLVE